MDGHLNRLSMTLVFSVINALTRRTHGYETFFLHPRAPPSQKYKSNSRQALAHLGGFLFSSFLLGLESLAISMTLLETNADPRRVTLVIEIVDAFLNYADDHRTGFRQPNHLLGFFNKVPGG